MTCVRMCLPSVGLALCRAERMSVVSLLTLVILNLSEKLELCNKWIVACKYICFLSVLNDHVALYASGLRHAILVRLSCNLSHICIIFESLV